MGKLFTSVFYHEYLSLFSTIARTIYRNLRGQKFEPDVAILDQFVFPGDICMDVGGAYGRYAFPLSRLVGPAGRVYSFEPGQYSQKVFSFARKFHGLKNVVLIKKALSAQPGEIKLCSPIKRSGKIGTSLSYISEEKPENTVAELVGVTTLDVFCRENNIVRVDFIKCDTEGSELLACQGGAATIDAYHPTVLSEIDMNNLSRFGQSITDAEGFFLKRQYRIFLFRNGVLKETDHIVDDGNYFFVHASKVGKVFPPRTEKI